jgi:acyl homoserine lactone synthase/acyl-homoserine lactone synthase
MPETLFASERAMEAAALRAMFAARKEVFIDLLGWNLPILAERFELDQFDDSDAEYLMLFDAGHPDEVRHRASARLLRTDHPHILGGLYPWLCDAQVPTGDAIREITRFCLDRHQRAAERRSARNQLVTALVHHALLNGIEAYTGVAELSWFTQIKEFGWDCQSLGAPRSDGRSWLVGLQITIDATTIGKLKAKGTYETSRLPTAGLRLPSATGDGVRA